MAIWKIRGSVVTTNTLSDQYPSQTKRIATGFTHCVLTEESYRDGRQGFPAIRRARTWLHLQFSHHRPSNPISPSFPRVRPGGTALRPGYLPHIFGFVVIDGFRVWYWFVFGKYLSHIFTHGRGIGDLELCRKIWVLEIIAFLIVIFLDWWPIYNIELMSIFSNRIIFSFEF